MPRLAFISDEDLEKAVENMLLQATHALKKVETKFDSNVIDPFAAVFEMAGFGLDEETWLVNERARKAQKTLSNHVGDFHQSVLGKVAGWANLGKGGGLDLLSKERKIIAEIKNKHNTVTGGKLVHVYTELDDCVMQKTSLYKDYTAYYVEIIPKKPRLYDVPFRPSDKAKGSRKPENVLIRKIDGYSFYNLVTGVDGALYQLFNVLPDVIQASKSVTNYQFHDFDFLKAFFKAAFGK